jgi:transposase-like protein
LTGAHLHPTARPQISTGVSSAAKDFDGENVLTIPAPADPASDGGSNRRSFTDAEKLAIVMEAERPGVSAAAVCRRRNIATSMIFRWRVQFGFGRGNPTTLAAVPDSCQMRACIGARPDVDCAQGRPSTTRLTAAHSSVVRRRPAKISPRRPPPKLRRKNLSAC